MTYKCCHEKLSTDMVFPITGPLLTDPVAILARQAPLEIAFGNAITTATVSRGYGLSNNTRNSKTLLWLDDISYNIIHGKLLSDNKIILGS